MGLRQHLRQCDPGQDPERRTHRGRRFWRHPLPHPEERPGGHVEPPPRLEGRGRGRGRARLHRQWGEPQAEPAVQGRDPVPVLLPGRLAQTPPRPPPGPPAPQSRGGFAEESYQGPPRPGPPAPPPPRNTITPPVEPV